MPPLEHRSRQGEGGHADPDANQNEVGSGEASCSGVKVSPAKAVATTMPLGDQGDAKFAIHPGRMATPSPTREARMLATWRLSDCWSARRGVVLPEALAGRGCCVLR